MYIISSSVAQGDLERVKDWEQVHNFKLKSITPQDLEKVLIATEIETN